MGQIKNIKLHIILNCQDGQKEGIRKEESPKGSLQCLLSVHSDANPGVQGSFQHDRPKQRFLHHHHNHQYPPRHHHHDNRVYSMAHTLPSLVPFLHHHHSHHHHDERDNYHHQAQNQGHSGPNVYCLFLYSLRG